MFEAPYSGWIYTQNMDTKMRWDTVNVMRYKVKRGMISDTALNYMTVGYVGRYRVLIANTAVLLFLLM